MNKLSLLSLALLAGSSMAMATEMTLSYASTSADLDCFGTGKSETFDVAIGLTSPTYQGFKVTEIQVPVQPSDQIEGFSVWIADELKLELVNGKNVNVTAWSQDLDYPADGTDLQWISVQLDEPYVIPASGIYVGYSFKVSNKNACDGTPIVATSAANTDAFYIHSNRSYLNWQDRSSELGRTLMTQVVIEGEFPALGAVISDLPDIAQVMDEIGEVTCKVYNAGSQPIESIDYISSIGEAWVERHVDFDTPLDVNPALGNSVTFETPIITKVGKYDYTLEITSVNGVANGSDGKASSVCDIIGFVPVRHSVMEEYTGTDCGYCPRGFAAMEEMNRLDPEFIGIAYHRYNAADPMYIASAYPVLFSSAPSAVVNRGPETDPMYCQLSGGYSNGFTTPQAIEEANSQYTPGEISATASLNEGIVTVESTVRWAQVPNDIETANYRIEYVLVGDGLSDESWSQNNYFSSSSASSYPEILADFCSGGIYGSSSVYGLTFNDVALITSGAKGVEGSIPSISLDQATTHEYTFDTADAVNSSGAVPFHEDQLYVVAMILGGKAYGTVVNACKVQVKSGIDGVSSIIRENREVESEMYYDLSGRAVANPGTGIYIRSTRYTDGTTSTSKIIR